MPVLKAKIGGVWVPLGSGGTGNDEVAIGPTVPTDPGIELWYDTDDSQGQAGGVPSAGAIGQVLTKLGNEDYNVGWVGGQQYSLMPRGQVARSVGTTSDVTVPAGTTAGIAGMSVSFTADPARRYRTTVSFCICSTSAAGAGTVQIATANVSVVVVGGGYASIGPLAANVMLPVSLTTVESGLTGSQTRQLAIASGAGQTLQYVGSFSRQGLIVVDDIGGV